MDSSTRHAAILLCKVMKTASKEMEYESKSTCFAAPLTAESSSAVGASTAPLPPTRPRLVSIGSQDTVSTTTTPSSSPNTSPWMHPISPLLSSVHHGIAFQLNDTHHDLSDQTKKNDASTRNSVENTLRKTLQQVPVEEEEVASDSSSSSSSSLQDQGASAATGVESHRVSTALVGKKAKGHVKAILRKKFAWKNYPELENFLIEHRAEYLQFSSSLNYTAEQKRYNNTLTNGLLELAEQHGYLFDDFTFPMVRDRIRCYYKSFVQAARKKQRRHG